MAGDLYKKLGVSSDKKEVHKAIDEIDMGSIIPDSFVIVTNDIAEDTRYGFVQHLDGSGTVSGTIYMIAKAKNDPKYMQRIAPFAVVMNTDDVACTAPYRKAFLSNVINRNTFRIDGEMLANTIKGFDQYLKGLKDTSEIYLISDIKLAGGETADVPDLVETLTVDAVLSARVERNKALSGNNIKPGDLIISLASRGKRAKYENYDVNDWGSNGHTLGKRSILSPVYNAQYPETLYAELTGRIPQKDSPKRLGSSDAANARNMLKKCYEDNEFVERMIEKGRGYYGEYELDDTIPGTGQTAADALSLPPRTYLPVTNALFEEFGGNGLHFIVQNSGGGQTKPINFGKGLLYNIYNFGDIPVFFSEVQKASNQSWRYMLSSFNCGRRLTIVVDPDVADEAVSFINKDFGVDAKITGEVLQNNAENPKNNRGNTLRIATEYGTFTYPEETK